MKTLKFIIALTILLPSCSARDVKTTVANKVKNLSFLATTKYNFTNIINYESIKTIFKLRKKALYAARVTLIAGIDFSKIQFSDFRIDGKKLFLKIPPPTIRFTIMPMHNIRTSIEKTSFLLSDIDEKHRILILRKAEGDLKKLHNNFGILEDAKRGAKEFLENLLAPMGFSYIEISVRGK